MESQSESMGKDFCNENSTTKKEQNKNNKINHETEVVSSILNNMLNVKNVAYSLGLYLGGFLIFIGVSDSPILYILSNYWPVILGAVIILICFVNLFKNISSQMIDRLDFTDVDEKYTGQRIARDSLVAETPGFPPVGKCNDEVMHTVINNGKFDMESRDPVCIYMQETISVLKRKADAADEKASILLQRGISYTKFGICFYLLSIIIWQAVFWFGSFKTEHLYGIITCSFLFLFIEFLSAWFLKQYKNFTDNSVYLIKVKSNFDRYLLIYLAELEMNKCERDDYFKCTLAALSKDIIWPDTAVIESKEDSFSKEALNSLTEFMKSIKKNDEGR